MTAPRLQGQALEQNDLHQAGQILRRGERYGDHEQGEKKIGEGGWGVVYMAEQLRPVRRKVALKVIKPGMDSKQVIARFEAERQALTSCC